MGEESCLSWVGLDWTEEQEEERVKLEFTKMMMMPSNL